PLTAREHLIKSAEIQRTLSMQFPKNPEHRAALAESIGFLGDVFAASGDNERASLQYERGIEIQEKVVAEFPSVATHHVILAGLHSHKAHRFEAAKDWQAALREYGKYAAIYARLATDSACPRYTSNALFGHRECARLLER